MAFRFGTAWGYAKPDGSTFYPHAGLWINCGGAWTLLTGGDSPHEGKFAVQLAASSYAEGSGTMLQPVLSGSAAYAHYGFLMQPGSWSGAGGKQRNAVFYNQVAGADPNYVWGLGTEYVSTTQTNIGLIQGVSPDTFVGAKKQMGYTTWCWIDVVIRISDMNAQLWVDDVLITDTGDDWEDPLDDTLCDGRISFYSIEFGSKSGAAWRLSSLICNDDLGNTMDGVLGSTYQDVPCSFPVCGVTGYVDFDDVDTPHNHDLQHWGNVDDDYDTADVDTGYNELVENTNGKEAYQMATIASGTVYGAQIYVTSYVAAGYAFGGIGAVSADRLLAYLEDPSGEPVETHTICGTTPTGAAATISWAAMAQAPGTQDWTTALFNKLGVGVERYDHTENADKDARIFKVYVEVYGTSLTQPADNPTVISNCTLAAAPPTEEAEAAVRRVRGLVV